MSSYPVLFFLYFCLNVLIFPHWVGHPTVLLALFIISVRCPEKSSWLSTTTPVSCSELISIIFSLMQYPASPVSHLTIRKHSHFVRPRSSCPAPVRVQEGVSLWPVRGFKNRRRGTPTNTFVWYACHAPLLSLAGVIPDVGSCSDSRSLQVKGWVWRLSAGTFPFPCWRSDIWLSVAEE